MNSSLNRTRIRTAVLTFVAFGVSQAALCRADEVDDALLHQAGEFEMDNGQTKIIAEHKTPEPYRVCVASGPDAISLVARFDGHEQTIAAGDCADLSGRIIALSPAVPLKQDEVLIGRYRHGGL